MRNDQREECTTLSTHKSPKRPLYGALDPAHEIPEIPLPPCPGLHYRVRAPIKINNPEPLIRLIAGQGNVVTPETFTSVP